MDGGQHTAYYVAETRFSSEQGHLGFRRSCAASSDTTPTHWHSVVAKVRDVLQGAEWRRPPPYMLALMHPQHDLVHTRAHLQWLLSRIRLVNSVGAPRMKLVWWSSLAALGRLPHWPEDRRHVLDAELLVEKWLRLCDDGGGVATDARRELRLAFFSHRWEQRETSGPEKATALSQYGEEGRSAAFRGTLFDYYFWIDSGCMPLEPEARRATAASLPLILGACGELVYFESEPRFYELSAWTRLERILTYALCHQPHVAVLQPSFLFRDADLMLKRDPAFYCRSPSGALCIFMTDPMEPGTVAADSEDLELIGVLCRLAFELPPLNQVAAEAAKLVWNAGPCSPVFGTDRMLVNLHIPRGHGGAAFHAGCAADILNRCGRRQSALGYATLSGGQEPELLCTKEDSQPTQEPAISTMGRRSEPSAPTPQCSSATNLLSPAPAVHSHSATCTAMPEWRWLEF